MYRFGALRRTVMASGVTETFGGEAPEDRVGVPRRAEVRPHLAHAGIDGRTRNCPRWPQLQQRIPRLETGRSPSRRATDQPAATPPSGSNARTCGYRRGI
jgi:hypothetical protein